MTHDDVNPPDKVTLQRDRLSIYPTSAFPVNCMMRFLSRGNYLQSRAVYFQPSSWQYIIIKRLSRWALLCKDGIAGADTAATALTAIFILGRIACM